MTVPTGTGALIDDAKCWKAIEWREAQREVRKLQMRIAKAVREGRYGKVSALQWTLTHSFYAKALAVKRVTSNKGKNTPGVDGVLWQGTRAKMRAVRSLRQHGYVSAPMEALVKKLNQTLRGWANYHRHVIASGAFYRVDWYVFQQLWRMLRERHSNKSKGWLIRKYWSRAGRHWRFSAHCRYGGKSRTYHLLALSSIGIKRHIKVRAHANPYMPEYGKYFADRRHKRAAREMKELSARAMRKRACLPRV